MKILILGGSYFLGKCFVKTCVEGDAQKELAENVELIVFNRGSRPLAIAGVVEIRGDRHSQEEREQIRGDYDAIVDFCAYQAGDIRDIVEIARTKKYIFVSTCDVYQRNRQEWLSEEAAFEERMFPGEAGAYIQGKIALEKELRELEGQYHFQGISIRPAFIYGPGNYAPREQLYFHWIQEAGQFLHPVDATGEFQMVYVEDVCKGMQRLLNMKDVKPSYNFTPEPVVNYEMLRDVLKKESPVPAEAVDIPTAMVLEKGIPLPFPLTKEESNWYRGDLAKDLIGGFTSLATGMRQTMDWYWRGATP